MQTATPNIGALLKNAKPENASRIQPGDTFSKPSSVGRRFDRSLPWVWDRVKNDAEFPKPVYDGSGMCFFIDRELDGYAVRRFVATPSDRANRARSGREKLAA